MDRSYAQDLLRAIIDAVVVVGGDGGVRLPLGEIPLPVALVWATWMLSRWKPRLNLVIEQTGPPKESE